MLLAVMLGCDTGSRREPPQEAIPVSTAELAGAIRAAVADGRGSTRTPLTAAELAWLASLYGAGSDGPLWVDEAGSPTGNARDALALLDAAGEEGLDPADYSSAALAAQSAALTTPSAEARPVVQIADFDVGMSANVLRYLRHLHTGRVDPRTIGFHITVPADDHDYVSVLRSALTDRRIADAASELAPPLVLYRNLRSMLARYRSLAAQETAAPHFDVRPPLEPGQPYADAEALHRRLVLLGDLPADAPAPGATATYEGPLVEGVQRFQRRHGLDADGVVGAGTAAALNVPLAGRVRQIELALERLRWLPHLSPDRFLAVNIPMFHLWGWNTVPLDGAPTFDMGAIVGRALDRETPVFVDQMEYIIFRPYWNVPASILRGELLPALRRAPDYFERQNLEVVAGERDSSPVVPLTEETIAQLARGRLRVRQRPGPTNSLGLVKFIFPNDANVYLHDTPASQLFSRSRRDFSHGCVRVEDPVALAEWALQGQDEWTRDRIVAAMHGNRTLQVNLARPIQVIIFYITAAVLPEDGAIHFAEDIYRHDERLDRALKSGGTK